MHHPTLHIVDSTFHFPIFPARERIVPEYLVLTTLPLSFRNVLTYHDEYYCSIVEGGSLPNYTIEVRRTTTSTLDEFLTFLFRNHADHLTSHGVMFSKNDTFK